MQLLNHILPLLSILKLEIQRTVTLHNINLSIDLNTTQACNRMSPCQTFYTVLPSTHSLLFTRTPLLRLGVPVRIDRRQQITLLRAVTPWQIPFPVSSVITCQRAPAFRNACTPCAYAVWATAVAICWCAGLARAPAVGAAEDRAEKGFQAGQVAGDDTDVGFNHSPDREVPAVPEPVAGFAVGG